MNDQPDDLYPKYGLTGVQHNIFEEVLLRCGVQRLLKPSIWNDLEMLSIIWEKKLREVSNITPWSRWTSIYWEIMNDKIFCTTK